MKPVRLAAIAAFVAVACASGTTSIGPLSMDVPKGWSVTSREGNTLQLANGTTGGGEGTRAGTAKAVFDIFANSNVTPEQYREDLLRINVGTKAEDIKVGGFDAVRLSYADGGSRQEAVFIERWDVRIVYRAAYGGDDAAFYAGRPAFRAALRSITFSDREPA